LLGELACRLARGPLHFGSFRELRTDLMARNYPAELDARLGYAPRPDYHSSDNHWGTEVSIDADGVRSNGAAPPPDGERVVAVGDSFTFGDQVDDDETWPALLERELQRPVTNGGVFGYSFAQMILRAEDLIERFAPQTLIVSFIADDLKRCRYSRRYTAVPWFDLTDDGVELQGVPIDHSQRPATSALKRALGYSALLDAIFANAAAQWWHIDEKQVPIDHLWAHTGEVGCGLVDRIAAFCDARDVQLVLVLQGDEAIDESRMVMAHAAERGVTTLDLVARYRELLAEDPSLAQRWFDGHMTKAGNQWVAAQLAELLRRAPR